MTHPLHTPEVIELLKSAPASEWTRRTGRTTVLAYRCIADALENPYRAIAIKDHYPLHRADMMLANEIRSIIEATGLREMHIEARAGSRPTLTFGKG